MKKKILAMLFALGMVFSAGCSKGSKEDKAHWSHKACVKHIAKNVGLEEYVYSVKEIEHEYEKGDDEVYCFDITVKSGAYEQRFMCFAVVDDGEVMFVDCDVWRE